MARVLRGNGDKFCQPIVQVVIGDPQDASVVADREGWVVDLSQANLTVVRRCPPRAARRSG